MAANEIVIGLRIRADSEEARRKVERIEKEIGRLGREARRAGAQGAAAFRQMATAARPASAQVANLAAQFNDIGQMLMAGQSPLMLAVQQGTQITQVLGPMGAKGAVKALGAAFTSLLSPVNLVTLGAIAGGAALVQWLTSAQEEARTLAETLDDVEASLKDLQRLMDRAAAPLSSFRREFGDAAEQARELYAAMADLARLEALDRLDAAAKKLKEEFSGGWFSGGLQGYLDQLAQLDQQLAHGVHPDDVARAKARVLENLREEYGLTRTEAEKLAAALERMGSAKGPQEVASAAQGLRDVFAEIEARAGKVPEQLRSAAGAVARMQLDALKLKAIAESERRAAEDREKVAKRLLETLQDEAVLKEMIRLYGEDSVAVERLRAFQAEQAFRARVEEMQISDQLKEKLIEAWQAARGLSTIDIASSFRAALDPVEELARKLERIVGDMETARRMAAASLSGSGRGGDPRKFGGSIADWQAVAQFGWHDPSDNKPTRHSGGGGGGISPVEKAKKAYDQLRASVDEAYAAHLRLAEAEKIVKDALRLNKKLSEEEARETLRLVRQSIEETMRVSDEFARSLKDGILDAITGARDLGDVFDQLAKQIQRAAWEALLFNEGMFASKGGGGGLLGGFIDLLTGALTGGGGTSAAVHHSGGVVGQASVTRTVPSWVFAGAPRYHRGGIAGLSPTEVPAILQQGEVVIPKGARLAGSGGRVQVLITVDESGNIRPVIQEVAGQVAAQVGEAQLEHYDRTVLPGRLATANPRRVG